MEGRIVLCQQLLRFGDLREDDNLIHSYVWLVVSNKNLSYEDEKRHTYIFVTIINSLITWHLCRIAYIISIILSRTLQYGKNISYICIAYTRHNTMFIRPTSKYLKNIITHIWYKYLRTWWNKNRWYFIMTFGSVIYRKLAIWRVLYLWR